MRRSQMRRRPTGRKETADGRTARLTLAEAWWKNGVKGKACVVCGTRRNIDGHHPISRNAITRAFPFGAALVDGGWQRATLYDRDAHLEGEYRSLDELIWDQRCCIPICRAEHFGHENATQRIPVSKLPEGVFEFARELNLEHRLGARFYAQ